MKKRTNQTCQICGRPLTVIIHGNGHTEKLCARCLAASYPALRELTRIVSAI